jgi:hypothetical protein
VLVNLLRKWKVGGSGSGSCSLAGSGHFDNEHLGV